MLRQPHVALDQFHYSRARLAALVELDRRYAQPFLEYAGGEAGVTARSHSAHIRPMGADAWQHHKLSLVVHRAEQGHVVKVSTAPVWIVDNENVSGRNIS